MKMDWKWTDIRLRRLKWKKYGLKMDKNGLKINWKGSKNRQKMNWKCNENDLKKIFIQGSILIAKNHYSLAIMNWNNVYWSWRKDKFFFIFHPFQLPRDLPSPFFDGTLPLFFNYNLHCPPAQVILFLIPSFLIICFLKIESD